MDDLQTRDSWKQFCLGFAKFLSPLYFFVMAIILVVGECSSADMAVLLFIGAVAAISWIAYAILSMKH